MRRYLRLYLAFARNCIIREMEYRVSFLLRAAGSVADGILPVIFLTFVFRHVKAVAGWTVDQMLLLMGTYTLIEGTLSTLFGSNMREISRYVNRGELDLVLTKPVSSQFYVSTRLVEWDSLPRVGLGIAITAYAFRGLDIQVTVKSFLVYLVLLCSGLAIGYSLWLISVCVGFLDRASEQRRVRFLHPSRIGTFAHSRVSGGRARAPDIRLACGIHHHGAHRGFIGHVYPPESRHRDCPCRIPPCGFFVCLAGGFKVLFQCE